MPRPHRLPVLTSLLVATTAAAVASAAPEAVRLLPSGGAAVHFVVEVPEPVLAPLPGDAATLRLGLEGYELHAPAGAPALPVRVVCVAVPPAGAVRVRSLGGGPRVIEDVRLAPMPRLVGPRGAEVEVYDRSPPAFAGPGTTPEPARLIGVSWMRNQRIARIAIQPARYQPDARRLSVWERVDVEVGVEPDAIQRLPAEPVDPFESAYREALVNYQQGRTWRRPSPQRKGFRQGLDGELKSFAITAAPETSLYAGREWVKLAITQTGFYKADFGQLRNTALFNGDTTTVLDSLRLFTWPGVPVLPEQSYCDSCEYRQVAIQFFDYFNNNVFSNNRDYFYFFALGPSDWTDLYDPAQPDSVFLDNPYETRNYYYLTISTANAPVGQGNLRIATASGSPTGGATTPATFDARMHYETDAEYFPDASPASANQLDLFWEKWYWRSISTGGASFTPPGINAPGVDATQPFRLRVRAWGLANFDTCFFSFRPPNHLLDASFNGTPLPRLGWDGSTGITIDATIASGLLTSGNSVQLTVPVLPTCRLREDRVGIAWVDLYYPRKFEAVNSELTFDSPQAAGDYLYVVDSVQSVSVPRVFEVTDPYRPIEITSVLYEDVGGGAHRLSFQRSQSGRERYRIIQDASIVKLPNPSVADAPFTSLQNLRSPTQGADYLVIYYDGFKSAADSLAAWRRVRLPFDGAPGPFETLSVPVSALYDQFSGGRTDPSAIRNFLRASLNWRRTPAFVTLLGDASYDFKNLTGRAPAGQPGALIPSYENGFDPFVFGGRQFASDDWIFNVDTAVEIVPDFYGSRIPVNDPSSALSYVRDKALFYERSAPLGEYRNRVMLVADDDVQGAIDDGLHWTHLSQTSALDSTATPGHIDRAYVYLHKFPDGPGNTKPAAKAEIKRDIAEGISIFNYIGHGSPFKIADEAVFLDVDTGTLTNADKLIVFISASCDVGKFNDPAVQSLGERLVTQPGGGAVGVISATELALSSQNATLNRVIYNRIFERDSLTGTGRYHNSLAAGLLAAKLQATETTQKYELLGDAAIEMNLPRLWAEITLWDSAGTTPITEVRRGQTVSFKGQVVARPGGAPVAYNGAANVLVEDSAPRELAPPCKLFPPCFRPLYDYRAGPIFRGDAGVSGGTFQGRFVAPLDALAGPHGRVRAYLEGRAAGEGFDSDAVGSLRTQVSPGTASPGDTEGPRITLSFAGGSTAVRPTAVLQVDLYDPSGILTTGHNVQNGIVVTLDDNTTTRVDITSSFRYAADSYQSGTASFQLPNPAAGPHVVKVSAADNLASGLGAGAHRSSATLAFEVVSNPPLNVARTYLFPDPATSGGPLGGGQFVVDAPGDSVNVLLRIYTVSGRLIRTLKAFGGQGQIQLPWDGRDDEGDALANGVYLFHVHVNARDPDGRSNPRQKAIAEGRFVIVH